MTSAFITEVGRRRPRKFAVEASQSLHLVYGLSYQKYNKNLMQSEYYQTLIIEDELKVLNDKVKALRKRLADASRVDLILTLREDVKRIFNEKIEETIGLLRQILRIVLFG
jgi:hypothetical protein